MEKNPLALCNELNATMFRIQRVPVKLDIFSVADPGSGAFLTLGSGMGKNQDQDSGRTSRIIFLREYIQFLGLKNT
jgi:hypothetical protein